MSNIKNLILYVLSFTFFHNNPILKYDLLCHSYSFDEITSAEISKLYEDILYIQS